MKAKNFFSAVSIVLAMALTFSCSSDDDGGGNENGGGDGGSVAYEGQTYKTVKIGTQTWFAENLNYDVAGSKCYGEDGEVYNEHGNIELSNAEVQANCDKYGRLYDWPMAMALPSSCNENSCSSQIQPKHKGICPSGWHVPSNDDWDVLINQVGGDETAGKHLKSRSGWEPYSGIENLDTYGFSALPGGWDSDGSFYRVGNGGIWWSASEINSHVAYGWRMDYNYDSANWVYSDKYSLDSVRCLQD